MTDDNYEGLSSAQVALCKWIHNTVDHHNHDIEDAIMGARLAFAKHQMPARDFEQAADRAREHYRRVTVTLAVNWIVRQVVLMGASLNAAVAEVKEINYTGWTVPDPMLKDGDGPDSRRLSPADMAGAIHLAKQVLVAVLR